MTLAVLQDWPVSHVSAALRQGRDWDDVGETRRVYELASVTKLLSAYGVLMAVEEGIFDLDSPLGPQGATVRHLLAHAAGVGFDEPTPQRAPGERRIYSSAGYEILAAAIEREAEMPFGEYLRLGVFEPLAMTDTEVYGSAGHGGRSTVADLCRFVDEVSAPSLLAPETVAESMTCQFPELRGIVPGYGMHKPCPWGLGWEIHGTKSPHWLAESMPAEVVGHFGMAGTYLWFDPTSGAAMIALTDRDFGQWAKPLWQDTNATIWQEIGE